jgi:hypothetical protein
MITKIIFLFSSDQHIQSYNGEVAISKKQQEENTENQRKSCTRRVPNKRFNSFHKKEEMQAHFTLKPYEN